MIKIIITGCNGRMGKALAALVRETGSAVIAAGIDIVKTPCNEFPIYSKIGEYTGDADVVVDFSHRSALSDILGYCISRRLPVVIATTGHDESQIAEIKKAAELIPVFKSANMSLGINLLAELVKRAAAALKENFDIEIVEKHHNKKLDAPSGTALLLADAAREGTKTDKQYVYDRHAVRKERDKSEIGIHSVRGGTIIGEHEVIFAGFNEVITLSHSAQSREVFAAGALRAAEFMSKIQAPGLYDMSSLLAR
jgi:4-hydroxy-tetrahydrodipicolinate reductase